MRTLDQPDLKSPLRVSRAELENLLATLDTEFVALSECLVSPGFRLMLGPSQFSGIHYNLAGNGRMIAGDGPSVELTPHTLVIMPKGMPFMLEGSATHIGPHTVVKAQPQTVPPGEPRRFVAGSDEPRTVFICGYFSALYGTSIDPFETLKRPIIERFDASDQIDVKLKAAMAELITEELGVGAMSGALMKQVFISLLRRSVASTSEWITRFSALGDAQIARAYTVMSTKPGGAHTVQTLAQAVGLSRSAFMARFVAAFGVPPMAVLRQLRMKQAAVLLSSNSLSIDQVAHEVGYRFRNSFSRAFQTHFGVDPSDYRADAHLRSKSN